MEKLILIDGNSLINRAFYATPPMNTKDGTPTNAVYSFINMLIRLTSDLNPTHMAVAFDRKAPTFRHEKYEGYKASRKPSPNELTTQFPVLKEVLKELKIACYEKDGFEADDIVGTLSKNCGMQTVIISGDRDVFQLVDQNVSVHFTKRGITEIESYTADNFYEKTGLQPERIIDLKAIMGDASDCIVGVPGIGEKGAMNLLSEFGSLEGIYQNLDSIKGALKDKLTAGRDSAFLSKELATIDTQMDIPCEKERLVYNFPFPSAAKQVFERLEFRTLAKKEIFEKDDSEIVQADQTMQTVSLEQLNLNDEFCFHADEFINIYAHGKMARIKLKQNFFDDGEDEFEVYQKLKPYFEESKNTVYLFNLKQTRHNLKAFDIDFAAKAEDISIKKYLANFTGRDESLSEIAAEYGIAAENPAQSIFELNKILDSELIAQNMQKLYKEVELPLSDVLYSMEVCGFKIDTTVLHELKLKYETQLSKLSEQIYKDAGENFNINSPKQLGVILFEKLGLQKGKKTKTGYSTGVEVLEKLIDEHAIIEKILQFRRIQKLLSTYIEGFLPLIDKNTGLVHTSFNQLVTTTGRLSSKEPNLQNIPVRDEGGREIRRFFIPRADNRILIAADYSQIELRLLAEFSNCKKLTDAFLRGDDIHSITAAEVFGVPISAVTAHMRRDAKAVNFGIIYGISDFGLSQNLNISRKVAAEYISKYFATYPEVKEYMSENVRLARQNGYITTILGRRRVIREINAPNFAVRSFGERAAMNMPLQGSSADIIKIAMVNVFNALNTAWLKSQLILQVHDELIVDAYESEKQAVYDILRKEMQSAVKLTVPLTVDISSGKNWVME